MTVIIDGGAGITFPDTAQQTNAVTMTGGNPLYYAARAWAKFSGAGAFTVSAGVNISSITGNGTGRYTVNFTTPMTDANYTVVATVIDTDTSQNYMVARVYGTPTASRFNIMVTKQTSGNPTDYSPDFVCVVVFR